MKVFQTKWSPGTGWTPSLPADNDVTIAFIFGSRSILSESPIINDLKSFYAEAIIIGCSTSGEIFGSEVKSDSLVLTAVSFEKTSARLSVADCPSSDKSFSAGNELAGQLASDDLQHVLVFSNGLNVNGTELSKGMSAHLPNCVGVTGGLAGDGESFTDTVVVTNNLKSSTAVAAIGLYGNSLNVTYGSAGGWRGFGPERSITRSEGAVLYELDGTSALQLYKSYLGEKKNDLPGSALLYPLLIKPDDEEKGVVRTILSIDDSKQSMTFAGDIQQGATAQLMRANNENLIEGASDAAKSCVIDQLHSSANKLAILVSCVGRKLVLKQRVEEEVEVVQDIVGKDVSIAGFYSYGELAPYSNNESCQLHNQTMTITLLSEN